MADRELLQQALDALVTARDYVNAEFVSRSNLYAAYPHKWASEREDLQRTDATIATLRAALDVAPAGPTLLGEVWMAFGTLDDGRLVALPEYAAVSEREVGNKIMESARREGYKGLLANRLESLGWSIRRVTLAAGVKEVPRG